MSQSPAAGVVTAVRWNELCPWLLLVRTARVALMVRVVALAVAGVFVTQWGWSAIEATFLDSTKAEPRLVLLTHRPAPPLWASAGSPQQSSTLFDSVDAHTYAGPLVRGWAWTIQPLTRLVSAEGWRQIVVLALAGAWVMAVWALFGGAIARIAALYLTRGETLGPVAALRFAIGTWPSTFAAPAFCFVVIAIFVALMMIAGFVMRLSLLAFLAAVVWPLMLLVGVAVAVLALGLIAGWPLMWSTVAAERTDAFDGVSRGYAFAFQRPLQLAFFLLVATALGLLAQAVVSIIVGGSLGATRWAIERGVGDGAYARAVFDGVAPPESEPLSGLQRASIRTIRFWSAGLSAVATAFPMAFLFSAAMGIYLLLRRLIDSTELGEVAFEEGSPERGLPPLVADAIGVPKTAPEPSPEPPGTVSQLRGGST